MLGSQESRPRWEPSLILGGVSKARGAGGRLKGNSWELSEVATGGSGTGDGRWQSGRLAQDREAVG